MARAGQKQMAVSFRFTPEVVEHLRRRAHASGDAQTELAQRYIEEGLPQDAHPLIHFRAGASLRRPALLGSRLDVAEVIATIRQNDNSVEAAAQYLEIPVEQVEAALAYYADFKDEVNAWSERVQGVAQRERERWERRQQALS